jgi:hypothetical protein
MPGGRRWRWSDEPFSYTKLCITIPALVFFGVVLTSAFEKGQKLMDHWLPSSNILDVAAVGLIALAGYLFFLKVVWRLLPTDIRARIPYDREEANELKGDVRSFWGLCKLILRPRN